MLSGAALLSLPFNSVVLFPALAQLELHDISFPARPRPGLASEPRQGWGTDGFSDRLHIRPRRCVNLVYRRTIAVVLLFILATFRLEYEDDYEHEF